jgi:hypothetical protein
MRYNIISLGLLLFWSSCSVLGQVSPNRLIENMTSRAPVLHILPISLVKSNNIKTCKTSFQNCYRNEEFFFGGSSYNQDGFCLNFWTNSSVPLGSFIIGHFIRRDEKNRIIELRSTILLSSQAELDSLLSKNDSLLFIAKNKGIWDKIYKFKYNPKGLLTSHDLLRVLDSIVLVREELKYNTIDSLLTYEVTEYISGDLKKVYKDSFIYEAKILKQQVHFENSIENFRKTFLYLNDFEQLIEQKSNGKELSETRLIFNKRGDLKSKTYRIFGRVEEKINYVYSSKKIKLIIEFPNDKTSVPSAKRRFYYRPDGLFKRTFDESEDGNVARFWQFKKKLPRLFCYRKIDRTGKIKNISKRSYEYEFF